MKRSSFGNLVSKVSRDNVVMFQISAVPMPRVRLCRKFRAQLRPSRLPKCLYAHNAMARVATLAEACGNPRRVRASCVFVCTVPYSMFYFDCAAAMNDNYYENDLDRFAASASHFHTFVFLSPSPILSPPAVPMRGSSPCLKMKCVRRTASLCGLNLNPFISPH